MAYHADDTFLPSWGDIRHREPIEPHEEFPSGFDDYPPKPKLGTPNPFESTVMQRMVPMEQLTPYGTMSDHGSGSETPAGIFHSQSAPGGKTHRGLGSLAHRRSVRVKETQKSLFLLCWPAVLSIVLMAVFGLRYWRHWALAHVVLFFVLGFGAILIGIGASGGWPGKASKTFFMVNGCCVMFMAIVGALLGIVCFQSYTKTYEIYKGSQFYQGVQPGINPGAHRDAGVIEFAEGSHVDGEHSIGFRNGDLYCAAPIVVPESNGYAGFWAVGTNCCGSRANWRCGGMDKSQQIRSGLVVLDENRFGVDEIPVYTKAAEEASEQFAIGMPKTPIFVRLSEDVTADRERYWQDAWNFIYSASAGVLIFMLAFVSVLNFASHGHLACAENYYSTEAYVFDDSKHEKVWVKKKPKKGSSHNIHSVDKYLSHF